MKNFVRICQPHTACGISAALIGGLQQVQAAELPLQPLAAAAYTPGVAATDAAYSGSSALLVWGLLLITALCIGALLLLILLQGDAAASRANVARPPRKQRRFSAIGSGGDWRGAWNRRAGALPIWKRRAVRAASGPSVALAVASASTVAAVAAAAIHSGDAQREPAAAAPAPPGVVLQRAGGAGELAGPILISATKR